MKKFGLVLIVVVLLAGLNIPVFAQIGVSTLIPRQPLGQIAANGFMESETAITVPANSQTNPYYTDRELGEGPEKGLNNAIWQLMSRSGNPDIRLSSKGFVMDTMPFNTLLKRNLMDTLPLQYQCEGRYISFSPVSGLDVNGVLSASKREVRYKNGLGNGISLNVQVTQDHWRKLIEIDSFASLGDVSGQEFVGFNFEVESDFYVPERENTKPRIQLGENSYIEVAQAWDSAQIPVYDKGGNFVEYRNNPIPIRSFFERIDGQLYFRKQIPTEWLKTAVYPVYTDTDITWGTASEFEGGQTEDIFCCEIDTLKFVVAFRDFDDGGAGKARVATVSGTTITWGATNEFSPNTGGYEIGVCKLATDKFALAYPGDGLDGYTVVGKVSTRTIAYGTPVEFNNGDSEDISCCQLGTDKYAIIYNDEAGGDDGRVNICTVSDDTITCGAGVDFRGAVVRDTSCCKLDTDKFIAFYQDTGVGNEARATVFSVSSTTPTVEDNDEIDGNSCFHMTCIQLDTDKALLVWRGGVDSDLLARIVTYSGYNITQGDIVKISEATQEAHPGATLVDSTHFVVSYKNSDGYGATRYCSFSGTTITLGDEEAFNSASTDFLGVCLIDTDKIVVCYQDDADVNDIGEAIVGDIAVVDPPTVTTQAVDDIEDTTATGNGNITNTGGENASAWGVCYKTTSGPTTADSTAAGSGAGGAGAFTASMTSLTPGQIYYVKAYATNSEGTSYGSQVDFYTLPGNPSSLVATPISTSQIDLTWTKGTGGDKTMVRHRTDAYPTDPANGTQTYFDTGVSYNHTTLSESTPYYYRAWAYDSDSGDYSSSYSQATALTFGKPTVTSSAATNVEETTATWNGNITSIGGVNADYRGFVWGTTSKADPGNIAPAETEYDTLWIQSGSYGTGAYDYNVTDLTPGTTWYFRACAHNTYGWDYSNTEQTVYTKPGDPNSLVATAVSTSQIDLTWTIGTGSEKSMVRRKTVSYPTDPADGIQVYFDTEASCNDTSLDQGVTYFYRVWAWDTNSGYSDGYSEDLETTPVGDLYLRLWYQPSTIITDTGFAGTADAGSSNVKIIDAELTQADDYWNLARLIIVTTDDHLAPEGETAVITDFLAATDELQFAALEAAVEAGDTYTIDFGTLTDRIVDSGTADSGSATTLRDDALIEADNYWNNMILEILTTTDGLAPQGEIAVITDFIAADDELQFADLTAAVGAGDTYELRSDGRITWGNNPDDLAATFGGIVPYGQPTPGVTEPESPDIIAPHVSPGMFTESPGTNMPGYGLFKFVSDGSGIPIQVLWFGIGFILSIALGVVVWVMTSEAGGRGDMLWTAVASGLVLSLFTVMGDGLIPAWTLIVYAIVAVGMILAQKFISI